VRKTGNTGRDTIDVSTVTRHLEIRESKNLDRCLRQQTTIAESVSVTGFGFWSGRDVNLTFSPATANTGTVFVRTDLPGQPRIPAVIQNRVNGPRRTTLVAHGFPVEMVEHVLAALAGLQIDNCEIHVDRAEMPGGDGSSQDFVDALSNTQIVPLDAPRRVTRIQSTIRVGDENSWIQAEPVDGDQLELTYLMQYDCPAIGIQSFSSEITPDVFRSEISPARTFVLVEEAQQLQKLGLGKRVTYQDVVVFSDSGPIENELRFANECARHKMLDMIGDFSLSGTDLIGKFTASRSGHRLNSQMVFALLQQFVKTKTIRMSA
jgi:UDP-3-O-[3-hydroxymyristoyl] N-acetylglucosamine deacetylase